MSEYRLQTSLIVYMHSQECAWFVTVRDIDMQVEKNKDNILPKLLIGANQTNYDALFKEELKKYDPLKVCPHLPRELEVLLK